MPPLRSRPPFATFPLLSNERLHLRRVVPSDVAVIQEITYYDGVASTSLSEALAMMEQIEQDSAKGDTVHWGICVKGSDEVVGTCGFYRGFAGNAGEIGYILRARYRGRGIMTSALSPVIAFGLKEMALNVIHAYTDPSNTASIGVLERLGFHQVPAARAELKFSLDSFSSIAKCEENAAG